MSDEVMSPECASLLPGYACCSVLACKAIPFMQCDVLQALPFGLWRMARHEAHGYCRAGHALPRGKRDAGGRGSDFISS